MSLSASSLAQEVKTQALANAQRSGSAGDALAALQAASFPERKTESWKYTSLQALADGHLNAIADGEINPPLPALSEHVVTINNGKLVDHNLPDGVTFATGSYTITPAFRDLPDRVASSLTQYPNSLVDVYGHTDTVGSAESNQRLSEQRAQAVANYLTSRGVDSSRIRWMGFPARNTRKSMKSCAAVTWRGMPHSIR